MNTEMPEVHPVAYSSPLWPCLQDIERLLKAQKTWREIAEALKEKGVSVHKGTCCNFYHRYLRRKARKKPLPIKLQDFTPVVNPRRLTVKPHVTEQPPLEVAE